MSCCRVRFSPCFIILFALFACVLCLALTSSLSLSLSGGSCSGRQWLIVVRKDRVELNVEKYGCLAKDGVPLADLWHDTHDMIMRINRISFPAVNQKPRQRKNFPIIVNCRRLVAHLPTFIPHSPSRVGVRTRLYTFTGFWTSWK